jgi:SAM-dependent methyltransferase
MRRRLLDLLVCPKCQGRFRLEAFKEEMVGGWAPTRVACSQTCAFLERAVDAAVSPADCALCYTFDVVEGALHCEACNAKFPIINGVPRLLRGALLARLQSRYPSFFARHLEFLPPTPLAHDPLAETFDSFTRQRLDLRPPGTDLAPEWNAHLRRNLGSALPLEALHDQLILDVGCGFGRHLYVACQRGAEVVGVDLSAGVDIARQNNLAHPRCHVVEADVLERPLPAGRFDVVWSFGVLHHLPLPRAGFDAAVSFARPDDGLVIIWVYGYRGMALTYRLSHMRSLHRVVRQMSTATRVRTSKTVAALLSALYWEPLRLARSSGLQRSVEALPLANYIDHGWVARVTAVHDRLSTPITSFHDRDELLAWCHAARLAEVCVEDTNRRGWRAHGRRRRIPHGSYPPDSGLTPRLGEPLHEA